MSTLRIETFSRTLQIALARAGVTVSLREAIFSPVAGSMISSANTRPTIRSSRDSIIPLPSLIASTSIPRMLLLRTLTSFASLFNTASIYSSVSGVFAGMISAPVLS